MIGMALFEYLVKQKRMKIFAISMPDIEYQLNKNKQSVINLAIKVPKYYHNFLDGNFKKDFWYNIGLFKT